LSDKVSGLTVKDWRSREAVVGTIVGFLRATWSRLVRADVCLVCLAWTVRAFAPGARAICCFGALTIAGEKLRAGYLSSRVVTLLRSPEMAYGSGGAGDTRSTRPKASCSARTRKDEAKDIDPSRAASTDATSPPRLIPRDWAASHSTSQNSTSSATLVRWPASEKLRLIRPLRCCLLLGRAG
jgi:hypothetical protein